MQLKRSLHQGIFLYIIGALALSCLIFLWISLSGELMERSCKARLITFRNELRSAADTISGDYNRMENKKFRVPCYTDLIYIFDSKNAIPVEAFNHSGALYHSVGTRSSTNVFLFEDNALTQAFSLPDVRMEFPHYACFNITSQPLYLALEGRTSYTSVTHQLSKLNTSYDCTDYDIERMFLVLPSREQIESIVEEVQDNPKELDDELWEFVGLDPDVVQMLVDKSAPYFEIRRRTQYVKGINRTKVHVHIITHGKDLKDFNYVEQIFKDCVQRLSKAGFAVFSGGAEQFDSLDHPLLMWKFEKIEPFNERNIRYELDGDRVDCLSLVNALGFAVEVEEAGGYPEHMEASPQQG